MAACYSHAVASQHKWGGSVEDYIAIHLWFDESKNHIGDFRHRALRHHTLGISEALKIFGEGLTLSSGRTIPTRWVCEQHMIEDFGRIPSVQDWLSKLAPEPWMASRARRLSIEQEVPCPNEPGSSTRSSPTSASTPTATCTATPPATRSA